MSVRGSVLRSHPTVLVRCGQVLFRHRNTIFPVVTVALLALCRPRVPFGSVADDRWLDLVGWLILVAGLILRGWVIGLQYIKRGGSHGRVYADGLVTGGVFGCSRNPLYVGNVLLVIGPAVMFNNPIVYMVAIPLSVLIYQAIVAAEEEYLAREYGDAYRAYCVRVRRWLPNPVCLLAASRGERFDWPRVVGADYSTAFGALGTGLAIMAYERLYLPVYGAAWTDLMPIWACVATLCVLYMVARALKKRGKLGRR